MDEDKKDLRRMNAYKGRMTEKRRTTKRKTEVRRTIMEEMEELERTELMQHAMTARCHLRNKQGYLRNESYSGPSRRRTI